MGQIFPRSLVVKSQKETLQHVENGMLHYVEKIYIQKIKYKHGNNSISSRAGGNVGWD